MSESVVVGIDYDVLVAAVVECIERFATSVFSYPILRQTGASISYEIIMATVGSPCNLTIRKLGSKRTELYFDGPKSLSPFDPFGISKAEIEMWSSCHEEDYIDGIYKNGSLEGFNSHNKVLSDYFEMFANELTECLIKDQIDGIVEKRSLTTGGREARGLNSDTVGKLRRLAEKREWAIANGLSIPIWSKACDGTIDRKTMKNHFPKLRERWEDKTYRIGEIEEFLKKLEESEESR